MNQQENVKGIRLDISIKTKRFFSILGVVALHSLFTIPVAIPLVLSIYITIGGLYIASFFLVLSPILLMIHHWFPQLPINFGIGDPPFIVELCLTGVLFIIGVMLCKMLRKVSRSFHLKVKQFVNRVRGQVQDQ